VLEPAATSVIIAGTNGKGSTSVALERLLLDCGHSVGTTLSPHVERFNERVRIGGQEVEDAALCAAFEAVDDARGDVPLTYFEFSAMAALLLFRKADLDVAILEVGLGGRLDAFNAVDADLAVVTSIGLDHQDYLGSDLEGIGREKAGVFRPGRPVVLGRVTDSVHAVAAALGCPTLVLDRDFQVTETATAWAYDCQALGMHCPGLPRGALAPDNCALALTAAAWLGQDGRPAVAVGCPNAADLAVVGLPGRMERHGHCGVDVILDVAHNPAAAGFLADQVALRYPGRRFVAILGTLGDKDAAGIVAALVGVVHSWVAVPTPGPRGQSATDLAARLDRPVTTASGMAEALALAVSFTASGDGILALGSFSAVEQARALLIDPPVARPA
jgi:dihydrofolate synthase/folylpolyglutamate synthase